MFDTGFMHSPWPRLYVNVYGPANGKHTRGRLLSIRAWITIRAWLDWIYLAVDTWPAPHPLWTDCRARRRLRSVRRAFASSPGPCNSLRDIKLDRSEIIIRPQQGWMVYGVGGGVLSCEGNRSVWTRDGRIENATTELRVVVYVSVWVCVFYVGIFNWGSIKQSNTSDLFGLFVCMCACVFIQANHKHYIQNQTKTIRKNIVHLNRNQTHTN